MLKRQPRVPARSPLGRMAAPQRKSRLAVPATLHRPGCIGASCGCAFSARLRHFSGTCLKLFTCFPVEMPGNVDYAGTPVPRSLRSPGVPQDKTGATIAAKGDPGNNLFAVITGTVKISSSSPDGRNAILNLIGPGEIFGEIAVLDGAPRSADATANTNCELYIIDRRDFLPFVKSQPALAMKFIELLCARLRWTSQQVEQVILQNLPGRLASALLGLTEERKFDSGSGTLAITQQEISEMVG